MVAAHRSRSSAAGRPGSRRPPLRARLVLLGLPQQPALVGREVAVRQQVGAAGERPAQRLRPAPARDPARGRRTAGPRARPSPGTRPAACTAGTRAARRRERLVIGRRLVADDAGHEARHRLDHDQRGRLAAGEHEVADRELAVAEVVGDALVDALVAAAQQREPRPGGELRARAPGRTAVRPARAGTADAAERRPRPRRTAARASSPCPRHRRTACRRRCDDGRSACVARVVEPHVEQTGVAGACPSSESPSGASRYSGKIVKTSMRIARPRPSTLARSDRAARRAGRRRRRPARARRRTTIGTSAPPSSTSRSCAGFASTAATRPSTAPSRVAHGRADELVHPELVVVGAGGSRRRGACIRGAPPPRSRSPSPRTARASAAWCGRAVATTSARSRPRSSIATISAPGTVRSGAVGGERHRDLAPQAVRRGRRGRPRGGARRLTAAPPLLRDVDAGLDAFDRAGGARRPGASPGSPGRACR